MKINQIPYVIFQATCQFSFKFCITLQCHDTEFLWNFLTETYALDKKSPSMYTFSDFECSNESSPYFLCHFWKHKVRVYSKFTSLFIIMKDNSSVFILVQNSYTLDKNSVSEIFGLLICLVKIHQIPHVIFETASQFLFKFCIILQCHER